MIVPLVVGLGSHHGDDQAAWLVLNRLSERNYPRERLVRLIHPLDLLDVVETDERLIICDASIEIDVTLQTLPEVQSASRAEHRRNATVVDARFSFRSNGIQRFCWPADKLVYERPSGTHDMSLCDVLELGRQLGSLPESVEIWAIEGQNWTAGAAPSPAVASAADRVADSIWEEYCYA